MTFADRLQVKLWRLLPPNFPTDLAEAFDDAKQTAVTDKSALNEAIEAAEQDKTDTPVSADGKDQKPGTNM